MRRRQSASERERKCARAHTQERKQEPERVVQISAVCGRMGERRGGRRGKEGGGKRENTIFGRGEFGKVGKLCQNKNLIHNLKNTEGQGVSRAYEQPLGRAAIFAAGLCPVDCVCVYVDCTLSIMHFLSPSLSLKLSLSYTLSFSLYSTCFLCSPLFYFTYIHLCVRACARAQVHICVRTCVCTYIYP